MPCSTKINSNKNAKLDLTLTPDALVLLFEHSADGRAYVSTGKIGYTVFLILCLIKLTRNHEYSNILYRKEEI